VLVLIGCERTTQAAVLNGLILAPIMHPCVNLVDFSRESDAKQAGSHGADSPAGQMATFPVWVRCPIWANIATGVPKSRYRCAEVVQESWEARLRE
jgi:hypothetical protein